MKECSDNFSVKNAPKRYLKIYFATISDQVGKRITIPNQYYIRNWEAFLTRFYLEKVVGWLTFS